MPSGGRHELPGLAGRGNTRGLGGAKPPGGDQQTKTAKGLTIILRACKFDIKTLR